MSLDEKVVKERDLVVKPRGTLSSLLRATDGSGSSSQTFVHQQIGHERTDSENHRLWRGRNEILERYARKGRPVPVRMQNLIRNADIGGNFQSVKKRVEGNPRILNINRTSGLLNYSYSGPVYARECNVDRNSTLFPAVPSDIGDRMIALGTTAIARTIPTNPVAGAAQFLGELREGLPTIPGSSYVNRGGLGGLADEYVNVEFGIKPIVSDLQKFGEAFRTSSEVLDQLERDSGRLVRRRYSFPEVREVSEPEVLSSNISYGSPPLRLANPSAFLQTSGRLTKQRVVTTRYWFSGAYTYYYDRGDSTRSRMKRTEQNLAKLFGLRLTPELLWELTPWSWLVDWKSNMGDAIHNFSAFHNDGLVMRYGYMMCHMTISDTYLLDGVVYADGTGGPLAQTFTTEVKKRVKATPYGFGLDPDAFTPRQWAILSALGISKGGKLL